MAQLYDILKPENRYWDRQNYKTIEAYNAALQVTATVYVGNLSFYTQQNSIKQLFSRAGNVKDIIMGIDNEGNPCGFCFVVFETRRQAQLSVQYISKTRLGGRIIRVDWDPGYLKGRQKGRGTSGQQKREDFRNKEDPERPRKKVATNYESTSYANRNNSYRDRGDGYRGDRQRGGDRSGQRREFKPRQYRGDRGDSGYRGERGGYRGDRGGYRGDRGDQGERTERHDRYDRGDSNYRGDRHDRGDRNHYGDRNQRSDRGDKGNNRGSDKRQQGQPRQYPHQSQNLPKQTAQQQEDY